MSETDLELYQYQLDQVEHSLKSDPNNEELLKLQNDLKELIALTAQYEQVSNNNENISSTTTATTTDTTTTLTGNRKRSRSPSTPPTTTTTTVTKKTSALIAHQFNIGQEVKAKWSQDGQYYKAIITAIGGADQIFSVQFRGYKDIEVVPLSDIQPLEKDKKKGIFEDISSSSTNIYNNNNNNNGSSIPTTNADDDDDINNNNNNSNSNDNNNNKHKKKDHHKNKSSNQSKVSEVDVKKNAWLNFAGSGDKKKKKQKISAINKKSIFKTPDNPDSKVGVIGSGRGMTSYQQRGRHSYNSNTDE